MIHHYRGMAKSNVRSNFATSEVVLKKYLYVLRPVTDEVQVNYEKLDKLFLEIVQAGVAGGV